MKPGPPPRPRPPPGPRPPGRPPAGHPRAEQESADRPSARRWWRAPWATPSGAWRGRGPGSLRRRLLLAAAAILGVALAAAGLSIGFVLHRFVRGQVDGRLDDRILSLVSDLRTGPDGGLSLGRDRDGPPFDRPRSGWYWQVRRGAALLGSTSLEGRELALAPPVLARARRDAGRPVPGDATGPWGEGLVVRSLAVPAGPGEGAGQAAGQGVGQESGRSVAEPATVLVATAPVAALRGPVLEGLRTVALCLAGIGAFLFAGVLLQVRLGLGPLRRLRDDLAAVRAGRRERLPGRQPAEIRPLAAEINALLDENAASLSHARAHLANLAHGLKTPLATLSMALADGGADRDGSLARLIEGMDRRVRHHLRRARAAAVGGPARTRADLAAHVADLRLVLLRLHGGKALAIETAIPDGLAVACDPQDLDEIVGNIVENACRWCRGRVGITAFPEAGRVVVVIEDDGPGLDAAAREDVLRRGRRLDESQPGSGFGLPIALELAELYGGSLGLEASGSGGLAVRLTLPA